MFDIHSPEENHLLAAFPPDSRERLYSHLKLVRMPLGKVLYESGEALHHVYFPINSIVSLLYVMQDGASAEIALVGHEGLCNRHHSLDQQLCRWRLPSLDRLPSNELDMTQELIANMLGARREGVTEAAEDLQKPGVIRYRRGKIIVLDRPKLESLCCECYSVVKKEVDRLLPRADTP